MGAGAGGRSARTRCAAGRRPGLSPRIGPASRRPGTPPGPLHLVDRRGHPGAGPGGSRHLLQPAGGRDPPPAGAPGRAGHAGRGRAARAGGSQPRRHGGGPEGVGRCRDPVGGRGFSREGCDAGGSGRGRHPTGHGRADAWRPAAAARGAGAGPGARRRRSRGRVVARPRGLDRRVRRRPRRHRTGGGDRWAPSYRDRRAPGGIRLPAEAGRLDDPAPGERRRRPSGAGVAAGGRRVAGGGGRGAPGAVVPAGRGARRRRHRRRGRGGALHLGPGRDRRGGGLHRPGPGGGLPPPDRVRQRGQPAPGAGHRAGAGPGRAGGAGGRTDADRRPALPGGVPARRRWGSGGPDAGALGRGLRSADHGAGQLRLLLDAHGRRRFGGGLHTGAGHPDGPDRGTDPGGARAQDGSPAHPQGSVCIGVRGRGWPLEPGVRHPSARPVVRGAGGGRADGQDDGRGPGLRTGPSGRADAGGDPGRGAGGRGCPGRHGDSECGGPGAGCARRRPGGGRPWGRRGVGAHGGGGDHLRAPRRPTHRGLQRRDPGILRGHGPGGARGPATHRAPTMPAHP